MNSPTKTRISDKLYKELMEIQNDHQALDQVLQRTLENGKRMQAQLTQRMQECWKQIAEETKVDVQRIVWVPDPSGPYILPAQQSFANPYEQQR